MVVSLVIAASFCRDQWDRKMRRMLVLCVLLSLGLPGLSPAVAEPLAKQLFGNKKAAADLRPRSFGSYTKGCLAGGRMLSVNGPAWQAMRLSRNRNWGHPDLVSYVEKLALDAKARDGWPGLLVGDMAQPRGGPMLTGHRSHQIGLDADIWLKPMPGRVLSAQEREDISAVSMLARDKLSVNKKVWSEGHVRLLKRAVSYPEVARIFVHPAIKKALCEASGRDSSWLRKVRPWWGHHYHFHVRLKCPRGNRGCVDQNPPPGGDGCGKQLDDWYAMLRNSMKPRKKPKKPSKKPSKPRKRRELTMAQLPRQCRTVLAAKDEPPVVQAVAGGAGTDANLPWLRGVVRFQSSPAEGIPLPQRKPKPEPPSEGQDN